MTKNKNISNLYELPPLATGENRTLTTSVVLMALSTFNKVTSSSSDYLFFSKDKPKSVSCYKFFFIGLIWQQLVL